MNFARSLLSLGLLCLGVGASVSSPKTFCATPSQQTASSIRVALVLDRGGKDDKSFNAAALKGATEAKNKLGIQLKDIEASDDTAYEPSLHSFAQKKYDLIIAVGIAQAQAVKKIAQEFPQQKFALVDSEVPQTNVRSLLFQEHEGSFLVGYLAATKAAEKSQQAPAVGFIGGMDVPIIRRFQLGFEQGAQLAQPKIKILSNYIGVTGEAWNNPTKAKELALNQYQRGASVIYVAAGNSNHGVFDAAETENRLAVGVDSNQNWIKPGHILTSMMKRVDLAVYNVIEDVTHQKFTGGTQRFGLRDKGIDLAMDENNRSLISGKDLKKIESLKQDIISGKIKVRDYYVESKK